MHGRARAEKILRLAAKMRPTVRELRCIRWRASAALILKAPRVGFS
jgi:hypothetical protein